MLAWRPLPRQPSKSFSIFFKVMKRLFLFPLSFPNQSARRLNSKSSERSDRDRGGTGGGGVWENQRGKGKGKQSEVWAVPPPPGQLQLRLQALLSIGEWRRRGDDVPHNSAYCLTSLCSAAQCASTGAVCVWCMLLWRGWGCEGGGVVYCSGHTWEEAVQWTSFFSFLLIWHGGWRWMRRVSEK